MKYLNYLFLVAILFVGSNLLAQDKVGYIKYQISDISSDNPEIMQQAAMLKNGFMEQYVTSDKTLTVTNTAGMSIIKNLNDKKSGNSTMYMDVMGQKYKVNMTDDDRKSMQGDTDMDISVEKIADETKDILGHKVTKTLIKAASGGEATTIQLWITEELDSGADDFNNMLQLGDEDFKIEGVPLEFTIDANGMMEMTYTATEIKKAGEIDSSVMKIDDTGYEEMSFEQFQRMGGGM